jgi:hypothetical protein
MSKNIRREYFSTAITIRHRSGKSHQMVCSDAYGTTMKLEKWRCSICGFEWFEPLSPSTKKSSIEHGCPQGCDDAGLIVEQIKAGDWFLKKPDWGV